MSRPHYKSDLSINKVPAPIDKDNVFLCHYDISTTDIHGIEPISDTSILTGMIQHQKIDTSTNKLSTGYQGKFGGALVISSPTNNLQTNISPWTVEGINEDVSSTEPGPIANSYTYKFTKTGTSDQWNGWEGAYGILPSAAINDYWCMSGYYKTSAAAGLTSLHLGLTANDWSSDVASIMSIDNTIIEDGAWHYFYIIMKFTVDCISPIIADGPSWPYSTQAGVLYINGLQWEKFSTPTYYSLGQKTSPSVVQYPMNILNLNEGTISCWFNPGQRFFLNSYNRIVGQASGPDTNEIQIMRSNATNFITFNISNNARVPVVGWNDVISTTTFVPNQWYCISATWSLSTGTMKLYINGILEDSSTGIVASSFPTLSGPLAVGYNSNYDNRIADGLIDELRIDKIARTDEDILSWYVSQCPFYAKERYKLVR